MYLNDLNRVMGSIVETIKNSTLSTDFAVEANDNKVTLLPLVPIPPNIHGDLINKVGLSFDKENHFYYFYL